MADKMGLRAHGRLQGKKTTSTRRARALFDNLESRILMANSAFLRLDTIAGESISEGFTGQIEVQNFQLSVGQTGRGIANGGRSAGRVSMPQLTFTAHDSKASPALLTAIDSGQVIATGTLSLATVPAGATHLAAFETWNFTQIRAVNETDAADSSGAGTLDTFTLQLGSAQVVTNQASSAPRSASFTAATATSSFSGTFPAPAPASATSVNLSLFTTDATPGMPNPGLINATSVNIGFNRPFAPADAANGVASNSSPLTDSVTVTDVPTATSTPALFYDMATGRPVSRYTFTQSAALGSGQ